MAGHSQFKNIMHRKGAQDAKRAKIFTKLIRELTTAARMGQPDPATNPRLRAPVDKRELEIDPRTGMKNYIANESGGWATSAGYLRWSFARSIHFGRVYTSGAHGTSGRESDLCEALRCLGQALHCLEDFPAHSNYCELALIELGYRDVFPHVGRDTKINLRGKMVYPLVTGTFGAVDFLHSVLG